MKATFIARMAAAGAVAATLLGFSAASAQQPLKIGMISTLSGPAGYLGVDIRDAFQLAIELEGGKLGGTPITLQIEDDALKPGQGKQIAEKFLKTDGIKLLTGIVFSNVAGAVVPDILEAGGIYVSPNAAPSNFAGKDCNKNYFVVSWQNDNFAEAAGQQANDLGFKKAFILAPNYQAGKDSLAGFKRLFKGEIAGELYTKLDQTDFAAELAQIRDAKPDMVYQFHPGGLGITFLKQYRQAGLEPALVVPSPSMDSTTLAAVGDVGLGVNVTSQWNSDFDNPASKKFVDAFMKKFNRVPTYYASQGYDTALAIAAALKATGGKVDDADAFRTAMLKADFQSVRGAFKFGPNQHPIQDWYSIKVQKDESGKLGLKTVGKVLTNHGDVYAKDCKL